MTDPTEALARAMIYRSRMWLDGTYPGRGQSSLRQELMAMDLTDAERDEATAARTRLMSMRIEDMPATADDLALLIDTIAMRHGYTTRADAWRHIGINPNRGRDLLARNANAIDWPIWFTARSYAL